MGAGLQKHSKGREQRTAAGPRFTRATHLALVQRGWREDSAVKNTAALSEDHGSNPCTHTVAQNYV